MCLCLCAYSASRHFFTLMASLARPFLWKPSCHGNTACLFELEVSFSIPHFCLLSVSFLHFLLSSLVLPWLPCLWHTSCCQSQSLAWKEMRSTNGQNGGKTDWHLCAPRKKNGEGGHLFWKVRRLGFKSNATYWNRKEMLIDIQKIMMTRMMQGTDEWKDWSWKRELQRQRKRVSWWKGRGEVIDFCSLWCLWYLFNHAATLIQAIWFNCAW